MPFGHLAVDFCRKESNYRLCVKEIRDKRFNGESRRRKKGRKRAEVVSIGRGKQA